MQANAFDLNYSDATIIYVDSTCIEFKEVFLEKLLPILPAGCLLIYRAYRWHMIRAASFGEITSPTSYNKKRKAQWMILK